MVSVGRVFCVALPFLLVVASIICLLIAGLTGVTSTDLYLFRVNTTGLSISPVTAKGLLDKAKNGRDVDATVHQLTKDQAAPAGTDPATLLSTNITAADLGLADLYDINLWGFCTTGQNDKRNCTKAQFDWAATYLNTSTLTTVGKAVNAQVELPKELVSSLNAFKTVTKWTQVVYVIAMIALGVELFFALFTSCSRAVSCLTWVIAGIASVAVCAFASLMTAMSVVVVGAVEATAKWYGVKGNVNTNFLAVTWLGAAFALAAGMFWVFTICCCKPESRSRSHRRSGSDQEKFIPNGSYAPLHDNRASYGQQQQYGMPPHQSGGIRHHDMAYEPYRPAH
ncbi:SUR7/PalI family-domain-containing protein [Apiospora arundinis]|uniref:Sur7 protein n=1 Tax=Apiospora arundinis TaxID=335852 RepID=A0ABR2HR33_9PEZI